MTGRVPSCSPSVWVPTKFQHSKHTPLYAYPLSDGLGANISPCIGRSFSAESWSGKGMLMRACPSGWVLSILLGALDFTRHPSKTVRLHLFGILRDAWQLQPSLQVCALPRIL